MTDAVDPVLVGALAAVGCGVAGLLVPAVVARLPEPPADPELADLAAAVEERALTTSEQMRLDEGPKRLYADVASAPALGPVCSLVAAAVAVVLVAALGVERDLVLFVPLVPLGVLLAAVDLHTRTLPRLVVRAGVVWALGYVAVVALLDGDAGLLARPLAGLAVVFAIFYALWWVRPGGLGYGDVRLAALIGLVLAQQGWAEVVVGVYAALVLFALPAVGVALVRRDRRELARHQPFGPFLLLGVLAGLLVGEPVARLVGG
ncbi:hypothetical protein GCM10023340_34970 [Nocardioides marinquilinus]|uniref:Prepilin type IV endopeptidase peptidase domain-containing protein n=1 Tax=Nocardioides marinquilinus TaxID=1210400 RepID=A0ABP9Q0D9_9ACTN